MKTKRVLAGMLSAAMVSAMLIGCSSSGGESQSSAVTSETGTQTQETKTYSLFIGDSWRSTIFDPGFQDTVAQELTKQTGVTLDIDMVQSENPDSEINVLLASGDLPDCMYVGGAIRSQMIRDGYVIELSDLIESNGSKIWDLSSPNGKRQMALSMGWDALYGTIPVML